MGAVIFDLDGTLIDSEPDIRATLNRVLAAEGLAPLDKEQVTGMIGDGATVLVTRGFAARGVESGPRQLAAFLADYALHSVDETAPYPGMVAALEALREAGHKLGVCTNKPEAATRAILAGLGMDGYFTAVKGGDSTPYRKPDPRHLAATLEALGVAEAVMVGDHANDMNAAAGLGVKSIFVPWGYGQARGDYTAAAPGDLPGIVAEIFK